VKTDLEIQKDVMEELKWTPLLNSTEIGVAVKNGIVTLTGTVDSYIKKVNAENAAKKVAGVHAIAENIEVEITSPGKKTDAEIAAAILHALKWHSIVPDEKIKIKVEDGWVTMDGEVEWEYQKTSTRNAVTNLLSVRGITDNINVAPKTLISFTADKVRSSIIKALHRRASRDADKITIETIGSKVLLGGTVHSLAEKEDAVAAAWSIPGVFWVENNIELESEVFVF
jgi:osmotically-inducible protein OsmY